MKYISFIISRKPTHALAISSNYLLMYEKSMNDLLRLSFSQLLNVPQFQDVIKIKTIGSTYMAASGLNNVRNVQADASITERWTHLATLVEFALELKKALQCINEQSFNHFVLKMGINHGPVSELFIYNLWSLNERFALFFHSNK